jgi:cobyrinic acid a,c-diamide synthase
VAKDECFCFLYKDNIELLERLGAEIVYFSPLDDKGLPEDISGLIIPGGYPELYSDRLSRNMSMLDSIRRSVSGGMPCMAESGGFMYLHSELEDTSGKFHKMAGVFDGKAFNTKGLAYFGYATVAPKNDCLLSKGMKVRGHVFHYWDSTDPGKDCEAVRPSGGKFECMHAKNNLFAGFPSLYYYSNPDMVHRFLTGCKDYSKK